MLTAATVSGLALAVFGAVVAAWPFIGPRVGMEIDVAALAAQLMPLLILTPAAALGLAWVGGSRRSRLARRLDRAGGLDDRMTTALALLDRRTTAGLAEHVYADAARAADTRPRLVERTFPARPHPAALRVLRAGAGAIVVLLLIAGLAALLPLLPGSAGGDASTESPSEHRNDGGARALDPHDDDDGAAPTGTQPTEPSAPDAADPPVPPPPDNPGALPPAAVGLRVLGSPFQPGDHMLASVRARPGAGLATDAAFALEIAVDGVRLPAGGRLALGPGRPDGAGRVVDLTDLPGSDAVLTPGAHVAIGVLTHPDGRTVRSEPVPFVIEGDAAGGGGGGGAEDQPQPPPTPPAPPPDPQQPEDGGQSGEPPPGPETPEPENTRREVVIPLFTGDETIKKTGPRLVLEPGGVPTREDAPPLVTLAEAVRRAEAAVDRTALSPSDRALVLRYLDALRARTRDSE